MATAGQVRPAAVSISGSTVGLLDPTQRSRVLSTPTSTLVFATFHPQTASASTRGLSSRDELCSGKRVVIETLPGGESFWRWVPRAQGVYSQTEEGEWPRVVDICGQHVMCSQEQWDIYKLDPEYNCTIHSAEEMPQITRKRTNDKSSSSSPESSQSTPPPINAGGASPKKRRLSPSAEEVPSQPTVVFEQHKKTRKAQVETESEEETDSEEEDEVAGMIIDDKSGVFGEKDPKEKKRRERRARQIKERRERREHPENRYTPSSPITEEISMIDLTINDPPPSQEQYQSQSQSQPQVQNTTPPQSQHVGFMPNQNPWTPNSPHTVFENSQETANQPATFSQETRASPFPSQHEIPLNLFHPPLPSSNDNPFNPFGYSQPHSKRRNSPSSTPAPKRTRTHSPSAKAEFTRKKYARERERRKKMEDMMRERREVRDFVFVDNLRRSVPRETSTPPNGYSGHTEFTPISEQWEPTPERESQPRYDDIEDPISLEEKVKRMAEINALEQAQARLRAEDQQRQVAEERRRREREERERLEREREREHRRQAEHERLERERIRVEHERREAERRKKEEERSRRQQQERWSYGPWTPQRALERYRVLSETFDALSFPSPITFDTIPWPVLYRPLTYSHTDVDWSSVEGFFKAVRPHMRIGEYRSLVEKSHKRFHPDRWRARRVLVGVEDEELREGLEVAVSTVAQAITPLWREVRG